VLFSLSIVLGVAALAAIGSLGKNLERAVEEQAKTLLGADLSISSRQPFSPEEERVWTGLGGKQARETSFNSMVYFPSNGGTRLAQVRALSGGFPFYGQFETEPAEAVAAFRRGAGALVEENLLIQYDAKPGDLMRVGRLTVPIVGALKKVPGESAALATISPRVYLPGADLAATGLTGKGTLVRYKIYFQFAPGVDVEQRVKAIQPELDKFRLGVETVERRKQDLGRAMENLYHFLNLTGLIALLLGGIGVASAVHVHVKQKLPTVAVLRCLGATVSQTFALYLGQGIALGVIGAVLGCTLGVVIQGALPATVGFFIPFDFQFRTEWLAVGRAGVAGFFVCVLFAFLPLLDVRSVPPLAALRLAWEPVAARRDPLRWVAGAGVGLVLFGFSLVLERNWRMALGFAVGLAVVFGALAGTGKLLIVTLRRWVRPTLPFVVRQGLAGLHRPNNRTLLLLFSLGLGTFLMTSIGLVERMLEGELIASGGPHQPNAILFDVEPDQETAVAELVRSLHLPVLDELPIVAMRISSINGRTVESILADKQKKIPGWTLRREYRSTYADHLREAERVVAGRWIGQVTNGPGAAPISLDQDLAKDLGVGLGDEISFDVAGVPIETRVASLREIDWRRVEPNFFVLFPRGVLEEAPSVNVVVTRVATSAESAALQRAVVKEFPNVSVIDLTLILQTLDAILGKVSSAIQFMALFTAVTGVIVLVSALVTGHFQRVRESILLRTLGASRRQVHGVLLVEYVSLGVLAALNGVLLALGASWVLARFVFHVRFAPEAWPVALAFVIVPLLTGGTGLVMSRGVLERAPMGLLREAE
jgi:putative ABC transport system permease protein